MAGDEDVLKLIGASPHWRAMSEIYPNLMSRFGQAISDADPDLRAALEAVARQQAAEIDPFDGHFSFTPMESRLARHLMSGGSTRQYAAGHGLSANTVRNQLQAIYEKTGVNRQAALVSLLFEAVGRPRPAAG